jgi:GMP synthase-like glutamine amidotransferase
MTRAVCLQHVSFEGPGAFATHLVSQGVRLERRLVPVEGLPPDPGDLLLVMGGPMSVNDPDAWIAEEAAFIRSALQGGTAVVGVCLGSQFMAKALGAAVWPAEAVEIGMTPVRLTDEGLRDPVFGTCPRRLEVFEWHGEVFDLPRGCVALAGSEVAPVQAFRYGDRAYGLLFHLEVEPAGIVALCRECPSDLRRAGLDADGVLRQAEPHLPRLHALAGLLIRHLLSLRGGPRGPGAEARPAGT